MTATLDRPETDFATQLRQQTTGCRLSTFGMTTRRTMSKAQIERVAETFHADSEHVGGSRKVIDRKHELVKPIYALLLRAKALIVAHTIDYPERGLRLAKVGKIDWLNEKVSEMQTELESYLVQLDEGWDEIKQQARERLGELYCEADYAVTPSRSFGLEISFPAIEPDRRLMTLHPELYAREQARIQSRFDDAVRNAEAAAAEQLQKLLQHFVAKLTETDEDGKRKTFKDSTFTNIIEFVQQFRELSIGSNDQLDELVGQIEQVASGIDISKVRKAGDAERRDVADQFAQLLAKVDSLAIDRPVREMDLE